MFPVFRVENTGSEFQTSIGFFGIKYHSSYYGFCSKTITATMTVIKYENDDVDDYQHLWLETKYFDIRR